MYNRVFIVGRVGWIDELKFLPNGTPVLHLRVATQERVGKKVMREWHDISVFGKMADICSNSLSKGRLVGIEGKLHTAIWTSKQDGKKHSKTEIHAEKVLFLDPKPEEDIDDDDIPF